MRIGIFDSGVGGLTVLNEALKIMPNEDYIYFADTYNVPYGTKSKNEVKSLIFDIAEFFKLKDIDALLIACNTATSIGVSELRKKYTFPIIGMEPAVKFALDNNKEKRVLVFATSLTLKEEKYSNLIKKVDHESRVDSLALPKLVEFAESYTFDKDIVLQYLNNVLALYDMSKYSSIVLGCTHFIYFRNLIKEVVPSEVSIVDGNYGTVKHLKNILGNEQETNKTGTVQYYQSTKKGIIKADFNKYMKLLT